MESLAQSLHGRARLVGVDWSDDLGNARDFVREHEWSFPVLRDSGEVGDEYGIGGLPTTFVLDARGRIVETLSGPQTRADLEAALRRSASRARPGHRGDGAVPLSRRFAGQLLKKSLSVSIAESWPATREPSSAISISSAPR